MKTNIYALLFAFVLLFISKAFEGTIIQKFCLYASLSYIAYSFVIMMIAWWRNR